MLLCKLCGCMSLFWSSGIQVVWVKVPPGEDLRPVAFSHQELIKGYLQFMLGWHIHLLNAYAWYVLNLWKLMSKTCLHSRFSVEMEGIWDEVGHPRKDPQIGHEEALTGSSSLMKPTVLLPWLPQNPELIRLRRLVCKPERQLGNSYQWSLVTGAVLDTFLPLWKNVRNWIGHKKVIY